MSLEGSMLVFGHISVSISNIHWSKWRSNLALQPGSLIDGTLGNGGGSGVARYRATSLAQSEYPARYLSVAVERKTYDNTIGNNGRFTHYLDYLNADVSGNVALLTPNVIHKSNWIKISNFNNKWPHGIYQYVRLFQFRVLWLTVRRFVRVFCRFQYQSFKYGQALVDSGSSPLFHQRLVGSF